MSIAKGEEHMSKAKTKSDNLPPLQKLIVLYFAKNEPKTINETVQALGKSYKPTWIAFNSLEEKKLIVKTGAKDYRGQKYPRFWLTDEGMILALMDGADANKLLAETKLLYPNAEVAHIFLEIIPLFDPEVLKMTYGYAKGKGKLEFAEVAQITLSGALSGMEIETGKKVANVLKKHPTHYAALKMVVQEMINTLNQLIQD
jgi:hypothetical protein